jgi:hypothetical protein
VNTVEGFASTTRVYSDVNLGLARSIVCGVSDVVARHGRVIVLEDDLVVTSHFLAYMNQGLLIYADEPRVASIHAYCYPVLEPLPDTFFLRGADCWGWATWARAWKHFEPNGQKLLNALRSQKLTRAFDMGGAYPYTRMLSNQIKGKNNSWAVRWHASCFLADMVTLYPGRSLVNNIGVDGSGTHCAPTDDFSQMLVDAQVTVERLVPREDAVAAAVFAKFLGRHTTILARAKRLSSRLVKRVVG